MIIEMYKAGMDDGGAKLFGNLSFVSAPGDIVAVTGGTMCGKTSLLLAMLGMRRLTEGWVSVDGDPVLPSTSAYYRHCISWVPQSFGFDGTTVREVAKSMLRLKLNKDEGYSEKDVLADFDSLDLSHGLMEQRFGDLDRAVAQRVLLALSAVYCRPILLLDRPTSLQDEEHSRMVAAYLRQPKFAETSIVVATDNPLLLQMASKVVSLNE